MFKFLNCRCNKFRSFNLFQKENICLSSGPALHESTMQVLHLTHQKNNDEDDIQKKIVYNSKLYYEQTIGEKIKRLNLNNVELIPPSNKPPPVLALKYFNITDENFNNVKKEDVSVNLPYGQHFSVELQNSHEKDTSNVGLNNVYNSSETSNQNLQLIDVKGKSCKYLHL